MKSFKLHLKELSKKDLQQKVVGLDTRLDKHSNAGRVMNTGKLSKDEFKQLLKKKVADGDVEVIPPSTGANKSSQFDLFSFELDGKSMAITLSNPVAGRGSKSTDANEESLMLVISAMYSGAEGKDEIAVKAQDKSIYERCVDKAGKTFTITHAKELIVYLEEKQDWFDSHIAQAKVFIKDFPKTPKYICMDRAGIEIWKQAEALFKAEEGFGGGAPDKDKWNPADIWVYYEDTPKFDTIDDLNKYLFDSIKNKNGIIGVSLKKGTGKLSYVNVGKNPEVDVTNVKSQFGKNFTLGVDMEFLGKGIPSDFSLYFRIFQASDKESIRGEATGKNAMQGKVKLDMIDVLSGGKYSERIRAAGGPNILKWDKNKKEYSLTANGLKKFKSVEKKWKKMRRWKNIKYKAGATLAEYERAFSNGVVGFLEELNKGYPTSKTKYRPWKENQGKSMINSRFQTIEMVWLFNKMPQEQQNNLAAGLLKFAKSMSDWSAAHAKLQ
jgi:hypothetical protein